MQDEPENLHDYEALNRYVNSLLAGDKAHASKRLRGSSAEAARMAAIFNSVTAHGSVPSDGFIARLRGRFIPEPHSSTHNGRFTRRGLLGGIAAAIAMLFAGAAGDRLALRLQSPSPGPGWVPVARLADLTPGTVLRFAAQDTLGHVMNVGGKLWALSAICTHQACILDWKSTDHLFWCGCHGAAFNADGSQHPIPSYDHVLQSLPRMPVTTMGGTVFVQLPQHFAALDPLPY